MKASETMVEAGARELTRRRLNGGDPDQPAVRWNGRECEPQDFPAWWDERDDFRAALEAALAASGSHPNIAGDG